jgi:hypothetical protein
MICDNNVARKCVLALSILVNHGSQFGTVMDLRVA